MKTKHRQSDLEYDSPELLMKRGRWSLWDEDDASSLWHQCSKEKETIYDEPPSIVVYPLKYLKYSTTTQRLIKPRWGCGMCGKPPPDSILTVWQLHNFNEVSAEMDARYDYRGPGGWIIR